MYCWTNAPFGFVRAGGSYRRRGKPLRKCCWESSLVCSWRGRTVRHGSSSRDLPVRTESRLSRCGKRGGLRWAPGDSGKSEVNGAAPGHSPFRVVCNLAEVQVNGVVEEVGC